MQFDIVGTNLMKTIVATIRKASPTFNTILNHMALVFIFQFSYLELKILLLLCFFSLPPSACGLEGGVS